LIICIFPLHCCTLYFRKDCLHVHFYNYVWHKCFSINAGCKWNVYLCLIWHDCIMFINKTNFVRHKTYNKQVLFLTWTYSSSKSASMICVAPENTVMWLEVIFWSNGLETDINDATNSLAGAEFCKTNIKGYPKHNMIQYYWVQQFTVFRILLCPAIYCLQNITVSSNLLSPEYYCVQQFAFSTKIFCAQLLLICTCSNILETVNCWTHCILGICVFLIFKCWYFLAL
jgi:hypothetical protein